MTRKVASEAAKERKRADAARRHAKRSADPVYRARMQEYARNRLAEKRADPEWHAEHKKKQRKYYRTRGNFCPTANPPGSGLIPSSPPIRNGVNGTMRNNASGITATRRSGRDI
jgi:hypothetical protein